MISNNTVLTYWQTFQPLHAGPVGSSSFFCRTLRPPCGCGSAGREGTRADFEGAHPQPGWRRLGRWTMTWGLDVAAGI